MNRFTGILDGPYGAYLRTLLEFRVDNLRKHMSQRDAGASAIELAVITAIVGAIAVALALVIKHVVTSNEAPIRNLSGQ
ncbi:MAG: hypothetical protein ACRDNF_09640 [Streptosporangiaceae bacterium]